MNIPVTGGAGYIGSATAEALVKAGHQVTVYGTHGWKLNMITLRK